MLERLRTRWLVMVTVGTLGLIALALIGMAVSAWLILADAGDPATHAFFAFVILFWLTCAVARGVQEGARDA